MNNTIYIGATRHKEGLLTNQIFTERPNEFIEMLRVTYPLIDLLFVNAEEYIAASKEVKKQGTARFKAYEQTKKF